MHNSHIVQVHDLFEENGTAYYVMDFVDGESLSARLKRTHLPLSENEALIILREVLDALETVHAQGIWHLDLKPGNIMIDKEGSAKVIDFGASKQMSATEGYTTTTTAMCYTPGYAPPEQIDQKMELIGPWTDLYALGGTLYNLLTCNQPPTVSEMQEDDAFIYPTSVSAQTRHLIKWMMTPKRQARPQSVAEVRQFLSRTFVEAENDREDTVFVPQKEKTQSIDNTGEKGRNKKMIGITIAVLVVFGILFFIWKQSGKTGIQDLKDSTLVNAIQQPTNKMKKVTNNYFKSALGVCSYTGEVDAKEQPHGTGEASFTDGRLYKGPFVHGKMEGKKAYFRYDNGDIFEGTFRNNGFSEGRYTMKKDGSYFVGTFKNGQPDDGIWYDNKGNKL